MGSSPDVTKWTDGLFNRLFCKAVSTSATFVFIMNALPDRFLSATEPVPRTVALKVLSLMHLVLFHLDIFAEMHLSRGNEILQRNKIPRWLFGLRKISCTSRCAQLTSILKLMPDTFKNSSDGTSAAI
ncbi:hypothetical protein TNCV_1201531 [Trichonephila clavipes]|nr:hypothetical protein TNCV_1201531 [Trichonephila clavipes]